MTETTAARVIVGVDGSPSSIAALRRGATLASALGVPLEAITTWEYPLTLDPYYPFPDDWSPEKDAEKVLRDSIKEALGHPASYPCTATARQGRASQVLIDESAHASMLVLGSRGHGGFAGLLLGSVSSACAAHAHCPVLIMHGAEE